MSIILMFKTHSFILFDIKSGSLHESEDQLYYLRIMKGTSDKKEDALEEVKFQKTRILDCLIDFFQVLFFFALCLITFDIFSNGVQQFVQKNLRNSNSAYNNRGEVIDLSLQVPQLQLDKIVWMYRPIKSELNHPQQVAERMNILNIKYYSQLDGYKIIEVNEQNYASHLQLDTIQKLQEVISILNERNKNHDNKVADQHKIIKRLIIYALIYENGGIFIDTRVTLLERFHAWIQDILTLPYVNVGDKLNSRINPKCVAFFNNDMSSLKTKEKIMRNYEFEKEVVVYPSIEDSFLACAKKSDFLHNLLNTYMDILVHEQKSTFLEGLDTNEALIGKTNKNQIYNDGHRLASHIVLQKKQASLDLSSNDSTYRKLAIDEFGLVTMNTNLGLGKYSKLFPEWNAVKAFAHLSKLTLTEFQHQVGKLRFMWEFNNRLFQMIGNHMMSSETSNDYIVKNSFIHQYFLKHFEHQSERAHFSGIQQHISKLQIFKNKAEHDFQISLQEEETLEGYSSNDKNPQWNSLNKIVWLIWDSGMEGHSNTVLELCHHNIKASAQKVGFRVIAVSNLTIDDYVSKELMDKIRDKIKNAKFQISKQTISDFWRLALLYEHGGIYLDASTYQTNETFDWILNLTRIPSKYIWNRYGQEPDSLIFFNSLYGSPLDWHLDNQYNNAKSQWHLSYESNFIAAVKNNELIKEWLDVMLDWTVSDFGKVEQQLKQVNIYNDRWTNWNSRYLTVMDSIKFVLGRRQKMIQENQERKSRYRNAADFYKLWSMSGHFLGQQKFRGETNYENSNYRLSYEENSLNNIYKYKYSQEYTESVLGPISFQTKFFSGDLGLMNKLVTNFYKYNYGNFSVSRLKEIVHPESVLGKMLIYRYPYKLIHLLEYYSNVTSCNEYKLQFKAVNKIWF